MATLTITIPDNVSTRVYTALCAKSLLPVSGANAKLVVIDWMKSVVRSYESEEAGGAAASSAATAVNTEVVLT